MTAKDVPSPIDLRDPATAARWAAEADRARPYRTEVFARIARELRAIAQAPIAVLELGSGPGGLASTVLASVPVRAYTLLDFSDAMHALARARIGDATKCRWMTTDFSKPGWAAGLGGFDAVVTVQAVHELRHKRHAAALHRAVREVLAPGGLYLVCDHFFGPGGMQNGELFGTIEEQADALSGVGFHDVRLLLQEGTLVLHRARAGARSSVT